MQVLSFLPYPCSAGTAWLSGECCILCFPATAGHGGWQAGGQAGERVGRRWAGGRASERAGGWNSQQACGGQCVPVLMGPNFTAPLLPNCSACLWPTPSLLRHVCPAGCATRGMGSKSASWCEAEGTHLPMCGPRGCAAAVQVCSLPRCGSYVHCRPSPLNVEFRVQKADNCTACYMY